MGVVAATECGGEWRVAGTDPGPVTVGVALERGRADGSRCRWHFACLADLHEWAGADADSWVAETELERLCDGGALVGVKYGPDGAPVGIAYDPARILRGPVPRFQREGEW